MSSTGHSPRDVVQSLERGLMVLREFSVKRTPLSISELAESLDLSRPAVRRMLLTLESLGYTTQTGSLWTLTPRVLEIGAGYFVSTSLPEIAHPFLHTLADELGETCTLAVYDRGEVVQTARAEVQRILPDAIRVGTRLPAHATALGTLLLGTLEPEELDEYFATATLARYTPATLVDESALRDRIERARVDGYAASAEELEAGMIAVAVPVIGDRTFLAALGAASTTARTSIEQLVDEAVPAMRLTAAEVARTYQLGNPSNRPSRRTL